MESSILLSSVSSAQRSLYGYSNAWESSSIFILGVIGFGVAFVAICAMVLSRWLRGRQAIQEAKFRAIEKLAEQGAVDRRVIERMLPEASQPRSSLLWRIVVTAGWLGLLAGILCFIVAGFSHGRDAEELVMAGVVLSFISTAIFATPFMFRELKKQQIF